MTTDLHSTLVQRRAARRELSAILVLAVVLPIIFLFWPSSPLLGAQPALTWRSIPGWIFNGVGHVSGFHVFVNAMGLLLFAPIVVGLGFRHVASITVGIASLTGDLQMLSSDAPARGLSGGVAFWMGVMLVIGWKPLRNAWTVLASSLAEPALGKRTEEFVLLFPTKLTGMMILGVALGLAVIQPATDLASMFGVSFVGPLAAAPGLKPGLVAHLSGFVLGLGIGALARRRLGQRQLPQSIPAT